MNTEAPNLISGQQMTIMVVAIVLGTTIGWSTMFVTLRKSPSTLFRLVSSAVIIRMLTIGFVIASAALLALTNSLSSEASTLLAGISGYVLGGIRSGEHTSSGNGNDGNSEDKGSG